MTLNGTVALRRAQAGRVPIESEFQVTNDPYA